MTSKVFVPLILVFVTLINLSHAQIHISERRFAPLNETFEMEREKIREEWRKIHAITDSKELKNYHVFLLTKASAAKIEHLLNFQNPYGLEPFANLDEFLDYLKERNPKLLGPEGDARAFFEKLEDWLITIETYQKAGVDPWMAGDKGESTIASAGVGAGAGAPPSFPPPTAISRKSKISDLELDPEGFKVVMDSHDFISMLKVLNKKDPGHRRLIDLYNKLVADESLLNETAYPDPLDNLGGGACVPLAYKRSHLAAFFNELTGQTESTGPTSKLINTGESDVSYFAPRYAGMSVDYKSELLFKMKEAALEILKKMESASGGPDDVAVKAEKDKKDRLQTLLQGFLNAGKHCPDAKKQWVVGELFPVYCPELHQWLNESLYSPTDLYSQAYLVAARLKQESLEKYLAKNIDLSAAEAATIYAATWDRLAPVLGLPLKKGAYASWARDLTAEGFLNHYTAELLWKTYRIENADRLQMELGVLFDFKGEKFNDFLAAAELQRFGLLRQGDVRNATEREVIKEYPALENFRPGLLTTTPVEKLTHYRQIMVIHGILRGDKDLVKTYLTHEMLDQEIGIDPLLGPFQNKKTTLWKFLLNDWNEEIYSGNVEGVAEVIKVLKEDSLLLQSLKAGNTLLSKVLLENGMTLTAADRTTLETKPSKKSIETLQALRASIADADELISVMNDNYLKIPEREEKIAASGAIFKRVVDPDWVEKIGVDSWEDQAGLLWGDIVRNEDGSIKYMNQHDAEKYCKGRGARLPIRTEFARLKQYFTSGITKQFAVPEFMLNWSGQWFWSQSFLAHNSTEAYYFFAVIGLITNVNRGNPKGSVRCVFGPVVLP